MALGLGAMLGCAGAPARPWRPAERAPDEAIVYLSSSCSGTLVAPDRVLTAAHCVEDPAPWTVRVDAAGSREVGVRDCAVHPEAYEAPRPCGHGPGASRAAHDLAVLRLASPIAVARPLEVVLVAPAFEPGWWRDRDVRLVGWDRRPALVGPLARREGGNRIVAAPGAYFVTAPRERGGFSTRVGDSGGPALLGGRVLGVLFGGPSPSSERSVYAATYAPVNARWLLEALGAEWGRDLADGERPRFGVTSRSTLR